jgi:Tol biopolymer transport system component
VNVVELNSASEENAPEVSADGLAIFLVSDRPGGPGQRDVYASTRSSRDASWSAPVLVAELSGPTVDFDPTPSADLLRMYMAVGPDPAAIDLYLAARPSTAQAWGPRTIIAELASPDQDVAPSLDATETTLFFASTRAGGKGGLDLWTATRVTRAVPFAAPQPVAELNSTADDSDPWVSADQRILYFASNRSGPLELYVATR